ncbi:MAG: hypothetical protein ACK6DO_07020 [Planctomycetia bacterium]
MSWLHFMEIPDRIGLWWIPGSGTAEVASLRPRRPHARRASADPFAFAGGFAGREGEHSIADAIGATWNRYWFTPAEAWQLAIVRILAGCLALALWWSYFNDLEAWFGPAGIISRELLSGWRSPWAVSLFDLVSAPASLRAAWFVGAIVLAMLTAGLATPVVSVLAAILFSSLLHRGPMLDGPADDVVAVMLWCLAIGRSGDALSVDRLLAARAGRPAPSPTVRTRVALGLLQVHAAVIATVAAVAQLKGDVWWDGTAAWWLATRSGSRVVDLTGLLAQSEYLTNLVTHAIPLWELLFAAGIWFVPLRRLLIPAALVAWPLIGIIAGEPAWGLALAALSTAFLRLTGRVG